MNDDPWDALALQQHLNEQVQQEIERLNRELFDCGAKNDAWALEQDKLLEQIAWMWERVRLSPEDIRYAAERGWPTLGKTT